MSKEELEENLKRIAQIRPAAAWETLMKTVDLAVAGTVQPKEPTGQKTVSNVSTTGDINAW